MQLFDSKGNTVILADTPLAASGGEGAVYRINSSNYSNSCGKIYFEKTLKKDKNKVFRLQFMVNNPPQIIRNNKFVICWAKELLYDNNKKFVGFIMPIAFPKSEKLYELATINISRKINSSIWGEKFDRSKPTSRLARLKLCVNIAIPISSIHKEKKYVLVDFKPQNLLITDDGRISLIDTDSFQIVDKKTGFSCHGSAATPEYAPPEVTKINFQKQYVNQSWDNFAVAISFYQILTGIHPFAGTIKPQFSQGTTIQDNIQKGYYALGNNKDKFLVIPPSHKSLLTEYPKSLSEKFKDTFDLGHSSPEKRLSVEEWGQFLTQLIKKLDTKSKSVKPEPTQILVTPEPVKSSNITIWIILLIIGLVILAFFLSKSSDDDNGTGQNQTIKGNIIITTSSDGIKKEFVTYNDLAPPSKVVCDFFYAIENHSWSEAHNLQDNSDWKNFKDFKSKDKGYGGVNKVIIFNVSQFEKSQNQTVVLLNYYAEDRYNDTKRKKHPVSKTSFFCHGIGLNYNQEFILQQNHYGNWKILSTKLLSLECTN